MREGRFSDEQVVAVLREADRTSVAEAAKKVKVSEQAIYVWRGHFSPDDRRPDPHIEAAAGRS